METWYFVARHDGFAIAVLGWDDGPFSTKPGEVEHITARPVRGPQAADDFMRLAPMLLGKRGAGLESRILAETSSGQLKVVSRIPAPLTRALAKLSDDELTDVADEWQRTGWEGNNTARVELAAIAAHGVVAIENSSVLYAYAYT